MIAEVIPEAYDAEGKRTFRPDSRKQSGFRPTFPIGRYLGQPLQTKCTDLADLRRFLNRCTYVSDKEQFGKDDYWQPPDQFEITKKGDCDDFALWTWRQLLSMGYAARFVVGTASRYGDGHAWVTFQAEGKTFLVESLKNTLSGSMPRISILRYKPNYSVGLDGDAIVYFKHENPKFNPSMLSAFALVCEWIWFYGLSSPGVTWKSLWVISLLIFGGRPSRPANIKPKRTITPEEALLTQLLVLR